MNDLKPGTLISAPMREDEGWVYAILTSEMRLVYVGQSVKPISRLSSHQRRWPGAAMLILDGPYDRGAELDNAERRWIERLDRPGRLTIGGRTFSYGELGNADYETLQRRFERGDGETPPWFVRRTREERARLKAEHEERMRRLDRGATRG